MNNDNPTLRYFDTEMRYLREAGLEFADLFPEQAGQLNLDKPGGPDPYVERLFEGFAFLMGRLREKLDDDLPELTEGLVSLLWPHYLRTIPSLSVVQMLPDLTQATRSDLLASGFDVHSQPMGPQRTRCSYTTTRDLTVHPLALESLTLAHELDGRSLLRLRFARGELTPWSAMDLGNLPLYLNADSALANALHHALTVNARAVHLRVPDAPERQLLDGYFIPGGFADADRLWPTGTSSFSGYQLVLEYFCFRENFMFLHLCGLERVQLPASARWFEVEVELKEAWPYPFTPSATHLRLNCVPVINLFPLEADPLLLDPLQSEYLLRPKRLQDGHTEIYSVDQVASLRQAVRSDYVPFTSFQHKGGMLSHDTPERYFHTRLKQGVSGLYDTWLILGGGGFELDRLNDNDALSLRLTGTNGQLPRKVLQGTLLDTPGKTRQPGLQVRNLCPPTLPCPPPNRDRFHWRVLGHLGSNYLSMLDNADVLRGTLALYDWTANEANRRRLKAIVEVRHSLVERFEKGYLIRGVDIEVTLDSGGFAGEGDICLFGEMLSRFFAIYADIHLFNQVTLILQPSGKCLRWNEKHSRKVPG